MIKKYIIYRKRNVRCIKKMPYMIIYKKSECIGAGECEALSPDLWKVNNEGKAILNGATLNPQTGNFELIISDDKYEKEFEVSRACPSGCIEIKKIQ